MWKLDAMRYRRLISRAVTLLLALVMCIYGLDAVSAHAQTPPAPASFPTGFYWQLVVGNNGLCVDVDGASTANNAVIDQWTCSTSNGSTGLPNQAFQFNPVSGGYGELQNENSGLDLNVYGGSTAEGAPIIQYTQNGTTNALWEPILLSNGSWQFQNENSGLCLDVPGNSSTLGLQLDQWPCKAGAAGTNQAFAATPPGGDLVSSVDVVGVAPSLMSNVVSTAWPEAVGLSPGASVSALMQATWAQTSIGKTDEPEPPTFSGGSISVSSDGAGGSTVTIDIPAGQFQANSSLPGWAIGALAGVVGIAAYLVGYGSCAVFFIGTNTAAVLGPIAAKVCIGVAIFAWTVASTFVDWVLTNQSITGFPWQQALGQALVSAVIGAGLAWLSPPVTKITQYIALGIQLYAVGVFNNFKYLLGGLWDGITAAWNYFFGTTVPTGTPAAMATAEDELGWTTEVASGPVTDVQGGTTYCMDAYGSNGNASAGQIVAINACNGDSSQDWTVWSNGAISNSGLCLDTQGGTNSDGGTQVNLEQCDGSSSQAWSQLYGNPATDGLLNVAAQDCLDDPASNTAPGTQLQIWTCNAGANQEWVLPVASSTPTSCTASTTGEAQLDESDFTATAPVPTSSSGSQNPITNAVAGNANAGRFTTGADQAVGDQYIVNMGSAQTFNEIQMAVPGSGTDYGRGYTVWVSSNGSSWTGVASCTGTGDPEVVSFPAQTDQYIEVVLTTANADYWWSMDYFYIDTAAAPVAPVPANCSASTAGEAVYNGSTFTASAPVPTSSTGAQNPVTNAVAGNASAGRFTTGAPQAAGDEYIVNMDLPQTFNEIQMAVPDSGTDYARAYKVEVSSNGSSWTTVASCTGTGDPEVVSFPAQTDQYIEVVLTGANPTYYWSMNFFYVYSDDYVAAAAPPTGGSLSTLGPNTVVFSPGEAESTIQSTVNAIYASQASNQFGSQRYALMFEPGTYGTSSDPLTINVGYYEEVEGLGQSPAATVINGVINSYNQCSDGPGTCYGTANFWRSMYNLTINVDTSGTTTETPGCTASSCCYNDGDDFWATSQDSPIRDVVVNGNLSLMDFCETPAWTSGGYIGNSEFNDGLVGNYSQQQFMVQDSDIDSWTNSVWNNVFCGDNGAPATAFTGLANQYTTLATCGPTEEEPYLYETSSGALAVFVPALESGQVGPTWASGNPGTSLPLSTFYVTTSSTTAAQVNAALAAGDNILFTPGVYDFNQTIDVTNPNTKIIGLGFPTLVPTAGQVTMDVADVPGVNLSGLIFDAGSTSPDLLTLGVAGSTANYSADPVTVDDVNFRVGGEEAGTTTTAFIDNSNYSILSNVWAWRADHGAGQTGTPDQDGVGGGANGCWTCDVSDTGLMVNGNDVDAYGLAVEHFEQTEVEWDGQGGRVVFFQNENPYEVPAQSDWMASPTQDGYPAFDVGVNVTSFNGYGMGSYSYFDQGVAIENAMAFEAPQTSRVQFNDIFTIFLNGAGGIESVINGTGAAVSSSFASTPADVVSYDGSGGSTPPAPPPPGGFPASFWGTGSGIPTESGGITFDFLNETNGAYPNNEVYWDVNGTEESIAQSPYYETTSCTACRITFYLGSPNSQYTDFVELNTSGTNLNIDTSRVNGWGLPLAINDYNSDGSDNVVGDDYGIFSESRAAVFSQFEDSVPAPFQQLATVDAPYEIPAPGFDAAFQPGGADAGYMTSYAAANGASSSDTTEEIFQCSAADLSPNAPLCAALNRGVAQLPAADWGDTYLYYQSAPANYYSQFWHTVAVNGLAYGFPYDDVNNQSSDIGNITNAKYVQVAIGF
jgi:hypothetical protein